MFVDTHCHLNMMVSKKPDELLSEDHFKLIDNFVEESRVASVTKIINIGTSVSESLNSIAIAKRYENVFATVAIHPCDCSENWRKDFEEIKKLVLNKEENKIIAIGEAGLDFYHKPFDKQRQIDAFVAHIELSLKHELPIIIHMRDAESEVLKVLEKYKKEIRGVNHCFVHDKAIADIFIEWGFYLGIGGPITYPKNQELREIVRDCPLDRILLETDAPFLTPQQFRGKRNHPKYLVSVAETLADLKSIDLSEVESVTTKNVKPLFS